MKSHIKQVCLVLCAGALLASTGAAWSQAAKSGLVQKVKGGEIDWGTGTIYATGSGLIPSASAAPNRTRAYQQAKGNARKEAVANLLTAIGGTTVSYEATGKDFVTEDKSLRGKIDAFARTVKILKEEKVKSGGHTMVRVTVGSRMYGPGSLGSALLKKQFEMAGSPAAPKFMAEKSADSMDQSDIERSRQSPRSEVTVDTTVRIHVRRAIYRTESTESLKSVKMAAETDAPEQQGPFTSVIIDTRGYELVRCMSPRVRKLDGTEVWGTVPVDADYAIENGIVSYVANMDDAKKNRRAGDNPLVLTAIGRAGGKAMSDAVISDSDAELVLAENGKTRFLDECKVILIVDPLK